MPKMTRAAYDAKLDKICDRYERVAGPSPMSTGLAAKMNEALEAFKATATIVETAPAPSSARSRPGKQAQRIARAVREALTAQAGPNLPAGVRLPAMQTAPKAPAAPQPPSTPLHLLGPDELAVMTVDQAAAERRSPFWRPPRESAPAAAVAESVQPAGKPLHEMSAEELALHAGDLFTRHGRDRGLVSPIWAA